MSDRGGLFLLIAILIALLYGGVLIGLESRYPYSFYDELLIALLLPILYTAFHYSRWMYIGLTVFTALVAAGVIWQINYDEFEYSIVTLGVLTCTALATAEIIHRAANRFRRTQETLQESEERWRSLAQNAPHLFAIVDQRGGLVFQNRPLWGDESPNRTGARIDGLLLPEFRIPMEACLRRVFENGEPGTLEIAVSTPQEGRKWYHVWVGPIQQDHQPLAMIVSIEITRRKLAEEEKQRLEKQLFFYQKMEAVGQLAGGVAHDFNNLLTVIEGYTDLALIRLPADDPLYSDVVEIRKAADRAIAITSQLLAFSRKQLFQPRVLNLNAIVSDMERMLRRLIGENIELVTVYGDGLRQIQADPGQIEQVIVNLAVNARDAMPKGGRLRIETANADLDGRYSAGHVDVASGEYVELTVADNGQGMDPEIQSRIFDPFFTTKETGKGTGLGLATVYGIVKQNQGHIEVFSRPGEGSTFKIYFPKADTAVSPVVLPSQPVRSNPGSETILLVEDESTVLNLIRRSLEECEYKVLTAGCGEDALEIARNYPGPIDLLVTDVVMPGMNGHELAPRISQIKPGIKILYMSGYTDDSIARQGLVDPDIAFIQKPFTPLTLVQKIQDILDPD
ncbi:MAG TPA: ATP-binding protein [bacterium]|nr:ATP-binding protein [bacterium]